MIDWIKLETNSLEDPRIQALVEDYGMAGFGIYILLRSHIEAHDEHRLPLDYVLKKVNTHTRKNRTISILSDYDLFVKDEFGLISACTLDPAYVMPGHTTPGHTTPGHTTPGHTTPGHRTPGHTTPGHTTPGHTTPGHRTPGHRTPGHRTPGHRTPRHEPTEV